MSTTHAHHQRIDPLDQFDDLLFESPEVCSHCFARIRDRTEHDLDRLGNGNRPTETVERVGDGDLGHAVEVHGGHGARRSYHAQTYCGQCGGDGHAHGDHIYSVQALRGVVDNIVRRLHERGYYPDVGTLYGVAISLKRDPDNQGRDREILATAVYLALDRGDERDGPGGVVRPGRPDATPR